MKEPDKGSYLLGLLLEKDATINVGSLGRVTFPAGYYTYAGSAQGPGGLSARLARHRRQEKKLHWHVDHLLTHARAVDVWTVVSDQRLECIWAQAMTRMTGAQIVAPRFGASDCRCSAHLVYFPRPPATAQITATLQFVTRRGTTVKYGKEIEGDLGHWLQKLIKGDEETREEAAHALSAIGKKAVPHLLELLNNADDDVRCWTAWALANTGLPETVTPLVDALEDDNCDVRTCAAMALGELRAAEAVPSLIAQLASWNGLLTRCAADALEKIGEEAVPALIEALEHPESRVRMWATRALGRIGSNATVEPLCQVYLYDENYLAQHYAEEALRAMGLLEMVLLE